MTIEARHVGWYSHEVGGVLGSKTWTATWNGHEISVVFRRFAAQKLYIDGNRCDDAPSWLFVTTDELPVKMRASISETDGSQHKIEVRLGLEPLGRGPACQIFVDSNWVGGDPQDHVWRPVLKAPYVLDEAMCVPLTQSAGLKGAWEASCELVHRSSLLSGRAPLALMVCSLLWAAANWLSGVVTLGPGLLVLLLFFVPLQIGFFYVMYGDHGEGYARQFGATLRGMLKPQAYLAGAMLYLLVFIGLLMCLVPGLVAAVACQWVPIYVARGQTADDAFRKSFALFRRHPGYTLLVVLLETFCTIGGVVSVVLSALWMPLAMGITLVAWETLTALPENSDLR